MLTSQSHFKNLSICVLLMNTVFFCFVFPDLVFIEFRSAYCQISTFAFPVGLYRSQNPTNNWPFKSRFCLFIFTTVLYRYKIIDV